MFDGNEGVLLARMTDAQAEARMEDLAKSLGVDVEEVRAPPKHSTFKMACRHLRRRRETTWTTLEKAQVIYVS